MANLKSKVQTTGKLKGKARSQTEIIAELSNAIDDENTNILLKGTKIYQYTFMITRLLRLLI